MKLLVAGCSVSDRGNLDYCYGDVLSEKLGYEYIHEGSGCGSNFRIWRVVTNMIMNKEITPEDKVVIQYTSTHRQEFWTSHPIDEKDYIGENQLVHPYKDFGHLIKFKMNSHSWQTHKKNKEFFKLYQDGHVSKDYANEVFAVNHFNFANTLIAYNINAVFLNAFTYYDSNLLVLPQGLDAIYIGVDDLKPEHIQQKNPAPSHFTDEGHTYVANCLYDYFKKNERRINIILRRPFK